MNEPTTTTTREGLVFRKSVGRCQVKMDGREISCSVSSLLWKDLEYPTADPSSIAPRVVGVRNIKKVSPVAVGDVVRFTEADDGTGRIVEILPRRNALSRRAPGPKPLEQVVVANVDQVVIVFATARPTLKWGLLDRYLVSAEAAGIPALICITKSDLMTDDALASDLADYERLGYPVVVTSAMSGAGMDEIAARLEGRVSVLMGKSGVGKTTLLNTIEPDLGLRVNEVNRATGKGKHTTTHLELFPLVCGGGIIDTPGMREIGLWNVRPEDLPRHFIEFRPHLGQCRFQSGCTHSHEPGCAIKQAVDDGTVSERRFQSYLNMRE